jgi:hypothetical protein
MFLNKKTDFCSRGKKILLEKIYNNKRGQVENKSVDKKNWMEDITFYVLVDKNMKLYYIPV